MPKLPALTSRDLIQLLEERGFVLDRVKGSHHIYYHPATGRQPRRITGQLNFTENYLYDHPWQSIQALAVVG